jgi:hypothetical protein
MPEIVTLLTPRELAEHLHCSERTLERRRLVGDGPPFVKIGQKIHYPLREFEKWLADNTRCSTSEATAPPGRPGRKAARASARTEQTPFV